MIGQTEVGEIAPVLAWIAAAALAFGPGAIGITKLVDAIRYFDSDDNPRLRILWIVAALVLGLVACLLFQINIVGGLFSQLPAFAGSTSLDGTAGQVLTGLALGGTASYHHERMDRASAQAAAARVFLDEVAVEE